MDKLLTNRSVFLLWLTASWISTAEADIALWQLGGSGLEWAEEVEGEATVIKRLIPVRLAY